MKKLKQLNYKNVINNKELQNLALGLYFEEDT